MFCGLTKYETQIKFSKVTITETKLTRWKNNNVNSPSSITNNELLKHSAANDPSPLLEATRTQWCQTTMLAVFVVSDTKSIAQVRKTTSLSAANKPGQFVQKQQPFFVRFGLPNLFRNNWIPPTTPYIPWQNLGPNWNGGWQQSWNWDFDYAKSEAAQLI